jgi:hypothetical protein
MKFSDLEVGDCFRFVSHLGQSALFRKDSKGTYSRVETLDGSTPAAAGEVYTLSGDSDVQKEEGRP